MLTQERLREFLRYDPETGVFTRLVRRTNAAKGSIAGSARTDGYLSIWIDGRAHTCHRLAWLYVYGRWPSDMIDHVNGIKNDNRIANLREASRSENNQNRSLAYSSNISSGLLGVYWHSQCGKWQAKITVNGRTKSLGLFAEKEKARIAYLSAKAIVHPFAPQ